MSAEHLLEVRNLKTYFDVRGGVLKAVDDVSFTIEAGETLGLVGESGCGKTVTANSIMRLVPIPPGRIAGGEILFEGVDVLKLSASEMRKIRGNKISMIFQEPMTSSTQFSQWEIRLPKSSAFIKNSPNERFGTGSLRPFALCAFQPLNRALMTTLIR